MARLIWGCYSVADHLERRAFVADLLMYDRLVIPTPSADDLARWEKHWNPERQERLLGILGGFAERVEWADPLRRKFEKEWCKPTQHATLTKQALTVRHWDQLPLLATIRTC